MPHASKQERKKYNRDYYLKHRDRIIAHVLSKPMTEERKSKMRAAHQRRYADPEYRKKILDYNRQWRLNNLDASRRIARLGRQRNVTRARASEKRWRTQNRLWTQQRDHKRRALKLGVTTNPKSIRVFIQGVRTSKEVTCYYCERPVSGKTAHIDHVIPLSKGGAHSIDNLCVACPHCNQTKLNKMLKDWVILGQQLLNL